MPYIKAIILFFFFITQTGNVEEHSFSNNKNDVYQTIINTAELNLDIPYDKKNLSGYDCSGLVQYCYASADIRIPRSSNEQFLQGEKINLDQAKPGDIICFSGFDKKSSRIGHVGIIQEKNGANIYFIHASSSKGVVVSSLEEQYYSKRYKGIVRY